MSATDVTARDQATTDGWAVARHRIRDDALGTLVLWAIFLAGVLVFTLSVAWFGQLDGSIWESATGLVRWYAGAVGVYLTAIYLPLYITHGRTRRAFLRQAPAILAVFVLVLAGLMTLGYAIEQLIYGIGGWPHHLDSDLRYDDGVRYFATFALFVCEYTVWTVGGTLAGASFYRRTTYGFAMIPILLAILAVFGVVTTESDWPPITGLLDAIGFDPSATGIPTIAATAAILALITGALTRSFVRDLPVRPRPA